MLTQDVLGLRENIFDVDRRHDAQRNLAIDSAEGEVVNAIAEGRNIRALGRIHIHRQQIFAFKIQMRRQFERKWRVAAFVLAQTMTVDPDSGRGHHSFEINKYTLAARLGWQLETSAIERDEF